MFPGTFDFAAPVSEGLTATTFEDTGVATGLYKYKIVPFSVAGEGPHSSEVTGFRKATNEEFLYVVYKETIDAEKKVAAALGVDRVCNNMRTGTTTVTGHQNGQVSYKFKISGFSGRGTWTYNDYTDYSVKINGSTYMDSGASKSGTVYGKLEVSGIYTGYVDFYETVSGGNANGGYFMVSQDGGAETKVPFSVVSSLH